MIFKTKIYYFTFDFNGENIQTMTKEHYSRFTGKLTEIKYLNRLTVVFLNDEHDIIIKICLNMQDDDKMVMVKGTTCSTEGNPFFF